jgi:tRNA threonylcarbamoyladenosine biosynthesis protein TsaE
MDLVSRITVCKPEDMVLLGQYMAQTLKGHELIFLHGDLGTGKTTFVKGYGVAFEIKEEILSPTFVLLREYIGTKLLFHYDLYRLVEISQLGDIDFFDHLGCEGIKIVEWADKFPEIAKYADWVIKFLSLGETKRQVEFYASPH